MKKLISIVLVAMLVLSCGTIAVFAQTDNASAKVESIAFSVLPDKLTYTDEDFILDMYLDEDETDPDKIQEAFDKAFLTFIPDLTGSEIVATYSDGTTDSVDSQLCEASVADTVKIREIFDIVQQYGEDSDELRAAVYREYTVNVEYKGAATSYTVEMIWQEYDGTSSMYEFVSYNDTEHREYVLEQDVYESTYIDDDGNEIPCQTLDIDTTGIEVTLRNIETGELEVFTEDIFIDFYHLTPDGAPKLTPGTYSVPAEVWAYDGVVPFTYTLTIVSENDEPQQDPTDNPDNPDESGKDEKPTEAADNNKDEGTTNPTQSGAAPSTSDTPKNTSGNNNAVQTGTNTPTAVLIVLLLSGAAVLFLSFRKKLGK